MIFENFISYYKGLALALHGQFREDETLTWFCTGRRSLMRFNGVLQIRSAPEEKTVALDRAVDTFFSRNLPFFWADFPPGAVSGLGKYLEDRRISLLARGMPAMHRSLSNLQNAELLCGIEITEVKTQQDMVDWLDVLMEGFTEPVESRLDFQKYLEYSMGIGQIVWRHFLARRNGDACAISTLLCAQQAAGIYHVTTLPRYRGQGLGKALTLAAMRAGQELRYSDAVLFATPDGLPLYKKLGFVTVVTADFYGWNGKPD